MNASLFRLFVAFAFGSFTQLALSQEYTGDHPEKRREGGGTC